MAYQIHYSPEYWFAAPPWTTGLHSIQSFIRQDDVYYNSFNLVECLLLFDSTERLQVILTIHFYIFDDFAETSALAAEVLRTTRRFKLITFRYRGIQEMTISTDFDSSYDFSKYWLLQIPYVRPCTTKYLTFRNFSNIRSLNSTNEPMDQINCSTRVKDVVIKGM